MLVDLFDFDIEGNIPTFYSSAALLLAGPRRVRDLFVEGRRIVEGGEVVSFDLSAAIARQKVLADKLSL